MAAGTAVSGIKMQTCFMLQNYRSYMSQSTRNVVGITDCASTIKSVCLYHVINSSFIRTHYVAMDTTLSTVDQYIAAQPEEHREMLETIRQTIRKAAPKATEGIGYGMPAYKQDGPVAYFALFKSHVGFYATPSGHEAFQKELSKYKLGKGSVQFPLDKPMPLALITKIVKFRVKANEAKATEKKQVKQTKQSKQTKK